MEELVKEEKQEQENKEVLRICVSKVAERALVAILERVNEGFEGGRLNRTQIANWVLVRTNENLSESDIREIRAEHFDEVTVLEAVLRKAKESGQVPKELREFLQHQAGFDNVPKKSAKHRLTKNVINDDIGTENETRGSSANP